MLEIIKIVFWVLCMGIYVHKIEICIANKICDKILIICKIKLLLTWNNLENALLNTGNPKGIVV